MTFLAVRLSTVYRLQGHKQRITVSVSYIPPVTRAYSIFAKKKKSHGYYVRDLIYGMDGNAQHNELQKKENVRGSTVNDYF